MALKPILQRKPEGQQGAYPVSPFRLFEDFFNDWAVKSAQSRSENWHPPVDVLEKEGNIVLRAEVPGMSEKDIDIQLEGSVLTIRGERKPESDAEGCTFHQVESFYGTFSRSFTLPNTIDAEKIDATCRNGVLSVTIPQRAEVKPRSIKVSA